MMMSSRIRSTRIALAVLLLALTACVPASIAQDLHAVLFDSRGNRLMFFDNRGLGNVLLELGDSSVGGIEVRHANGEKSTFTPAKDNDLARGTILKTVLQSAADGDVIYLAGSVYRTESSLNLQANNVTIVGNKARIVRENNKPTDYVVRFGGENVIVMDIEVDGNGDNNTVTTERGETVRLDGKNISVFRVFAHDAPGAVGTPNPQGIITSSAVNFYLTGESISLHDCIADNPGWANYRSKCRTAAFYNCDSLVTTRKANTKARHYDTDGDCDTVVVKGGRWWTDQDYEVQAVFDPGGSGQHGKSLLIDGVRLDYEDHDDLTGDGLVKVDEFDTVYISNVDQSNSGDVDSFLWIGSEIGELYLDNLALDGWIHFGNNDNVYVDQLVVRNSVIGRKPIKHGIVNCIACNRIVIYDTSIRNITGGGSQASGLNCVFENAATSTTQTIRLYNVEVRTNFSEVGTLFRHVRAIGHVAMTGVSRVNAGSGILLAPTPAQRLMGSVKCDDEMTAYLGWGVLRAGAGLAPLGTTTWDHTVPSPSDPGTAGGDWFGGAIAGPVGAKIVNMNYGNGGNAFPAQWIKTEGGTFVDN